MIVKTGLRSTLALIAVALMVGSPQAVAGSINPPNVIIILADDLGYGDLGVQGGRDVATPRIDQLAREGVRLTDYYANNPVCAPSRAALMSGQYQQRFGFENNPGMAERTSPDFKLSALPTLPERLRKSGYATAMFGKWHLGFTPGNTPIDRGFDIFYGFLDGAMAYTPEGRTGSKAMLRGTVPTAMPAHTTEAFASEAVQFIEANTARPFFVYASFNAVHAPMQSTDRYLARFKSEPDPKRRAHLAMLAALDDAVGPPLSLVKTMRVFLPRPLRSTASIMAPTASSRAASIARCARRLGSGSDLKRAR